MSILAVSGSQGARLRSSVGTTGPRGKEIYCQTGGAPGARITGFIFPSQKNSPPVDPTGDIDEGFALDISDDQVVYQ